MTFSLKGLKTIILQTTNTSQHVEFFHSLIFSERFFTIQLGKLLSNDFPSVIRQNEL